MKTLQTSQTNSLKSSKQKQNRAQNKGNKDDLNSVKYLLLNDFHIIFFLMVTLLCWPLNYMIDQN